MKVCPTISCENHSHPSPKWYVKNGYYKPKTTQQKTPRYKCKSCGKSFSTHTAKPTAYQKRPDINFLLFKLLVSGVSLRRAATLLKTEYNTVVRHFNYLAQKAQRLHLENLKTIQTALVQVDEMETFIHARPKALSIPMVVRVKTGEILGFAVAQMPAKGLLATIGANLYGWTVDERPVKFQSMLVLLKSSFKPNVTFKCDSNTSYPKWIKNSIRGAQLEQIVAAKAKPKKGGKKPKDELFAINNTFARMRHDMNRLGRKTWSTTKSIQGLENHIWLYVAWNNGYTMK